MKISPFSNIATLSAMMLFSASLSAQSISDSTAIKSILQEEAVSWNKGDAKTYSQHFAADGTFTNILGHFFIGHEEFMVRHNQVFKGVFSGTTMNYNIVSFKFVGKDVAVVESLTSVSGFSQNGPPKGSSLDEKGRLRTRLLQVMKRDGKDWKIIAYHNIDIKPGVPVPEPK